MKAVNVNEVLNILYKYGKFIFVTDEKKYSSMVDEIANLKTLKQEPAWIPIKTRPLTEEERQYYSDLGYSEDEITFMYDCPLPDDGQEILVTDEFGNVETDVFCRDGDMCYFENNDDEVKAWMPLPQPYREEPNGRT